MKQLPTLVGALALSCASVSSHAQSSETLTGTVRLSTAVPLAGIKPAAVLSRHRLHWPTL